MGKHKTKIVIAYTEILSRAISSIEKEICEWECKCADLPVENKEKMLS